MMVVVVISGLMLGSFYNVCIYRISRGESIIFPPSHCPICKHRLKPGDLVPVLNYILLRGRCRYCDSRISLRYPMVELITAVTVLLLYHRYYISGQFFAYTVLISILIITSFIDLDIQIIPNCLVVFSTVVGIVASLLDWTVSLADAVLGLLAGGGTLILVGLLALVIFRKEGMGGGDIKLMGMIGLFLGWKMTILALLLTIYAGGITSAFLLLFKKKKLGQAIPFCPFIGLGTVTALLWGFPIMSWYISNFIGG